MDDIPVTYSNRANGCYVSLRGEGLGVQLLNFTQLSRAKLNLGWSLHV